MCSGRLPIFDRRNVTCRVATADRTSRRLLARDHRQDQSTSTSSRPQTGPVDVYWLATTDRTSRRLLAHDHRQDQSTSTGSRPQTG
ncbi:hypothetical protein LSAT2_024146, partial [Lamellibrachia satsuma]